LASEISKTQIDHLGDRLKKGRIADNDLRQLDEYRLSFSAAHEFVVAAIRSKLKLHPTGRPAKSTTSIAEKLRRETIRLTQIQDIAGCRIVVPEIVEQERAVDSLRNLFENTTVVDRRAQPSHGYRSVHVIVKHGSELVEIQVRTSLQHLWAEWSEKLSDLVHPDIKYGGGDQEWVQLLLNGSGLVANVESLELKVANAEKRGDRFVTLGTPSEPEVVSIDDWRRRQSSVKQDVLRFLRDAIDSFPGTGGGS
jgi:putative GTP pyrophosphokinase